ncbi:MAG: SBBP repeat-containing protein, partial [Bacteriovoracaceae bacterium]|nr:SBBP repeat-containing protein [Bacteriovoracaceae bacterium]
MRKILFLVGMLFIFGCNSSKKTSVVATPWTGIKQMGVIAEDTAAWDTATDSIGNVYVTGTTYGNLDGNILTGTVDAFLVKYDASGVKQWSKLLGVAGVGTEAYGIGVDPSGNIYITGYTYGNLANTLAGTLDYFLAKYDSSGNLIWVRQEGVASSSSSGSKLVFDSSGNPYICGSTTGNLNGETKTGIRDLAVIKYNPSGALQDTLLMGVSGTYTSCSDFTVSSAGNFYLTGDTNGGLGGQTLNGSYDAYILKLDSSLSPQWTRLVGVSSFVALGKGIDVDSSENVYMAGYTTGSLPGNTLVGGFDLFLTKYNSSGTQQFLHQLGVSGASSFSEKLIVDSNDNIFIVGRTTGNLGGETLTGTGDAALLKYDASGNRIFTKLLGTAGAYTGGYAIAYDAFSSSLFIVGETGGGL